MKYAGYILSFMVIFSCRVAFAETIVLKSGKQVQGRILERTKEYIKVDYKPSPIYYSWDSVESIDGQAVPGRTKKQQPQQQSIAEVESDGEKTKELLDSKDKEIESLRKQLSEYDQVKRDFIALKQAFVKLQAKYFNNLGGTFLYEKAYDRAAMAFQEALDADPWNPEACFNLGMLYDDYLNDPKAAVSFYERYLVLTPNAQDRREVENRISELK